MEEREEVSGCFIAYIYLYYTQMRGFQRLNGIEETRERRLGGIQRDSKEESIFIFNSESERDARWVVIAL